MSVDPKIVEQQLAAIGESARWWDQREVRELPAILQPDERIFAVVTARLLQRFRPGSRWVVVVTGERVACIKQGEPFGRKQLDIALAPITSIGHRTGLFWSRVNIASGDRKHRFRLSKADGLKLVGALSMLIRNVEMPAGAPRPALPGVASREDLERMQGRMDLVEDELERLRQQIDFVEDLLKRREDTLIGAGLLQSPTSTSR